MKEWFELVDLLSTSILKIETPGGHGTGFLCGYNQAKSIVGIATALHVIKHADKWQEPIRLHNKGADTTVLLRESDRVIIPAKQGDSAVIVLLSEPIIQALKLPKEPIGFISSGKHLRVGVEVAWLGYPGIAPETLCFFSGNISAWQEADAEYLIDGVVINGISGGPVFRRAGDTVDIIGSITAYMPNRLTSGTLPGLSVAQDVSHFQEFLTYLKNRDDAEKKKQEQATAPVAEVGALPLASSK
jgi:hypothetical protein